jgi:IS5 family transposase
MFKMLVLQQRNGLSDRELEKECIDIISFIKFLDFPEYISESTTICSFIKIIIENFKGINLETVKKPT